MKKYLAPMEGITSYIYRNAIHGLKDNGIDKYFAPFIMPHSKCDMNEKELREMLPENNRGLFLVPQILTDKAEEVLRYEKVFSDMGYEELNINIGCPSGTVTSKGRGAGFLARTEDLDFFLEKIYSGNFHRISVKTRIGIENTDEFEKIFEIYNKYPISELIIHPRLLKEKYKGIPHREIFFDALKKSRIPLVYNGDINTADDLQKLTEAAAKECPGKEFDIMIGRGAVGDPALFREIKGGSPISPEELLKMLFEIEEGYARVTKGGELQIIGRLKEIWVYLSRLYPDRSRDIKKMFKCRHLAEFKALESRIIYSGA